MTSHDYDLNVNLILRVVPGSSNEFKDILQTTFPCFQDVVQQSHETLVGVNRNEIKWLKRDQLRLKKKHSRADIDRETQKILYSEIVQSKIVLAIF